MVTFTATLFLLLISAGAAGLGALLFALGVVGFNDASYESNDQIGIEFGVKVDAVGGEIWVWVRAPWPMYVHTSISNIFKLDDEGDLEPGAITDLFPVGKGKGQIDFEMYSIDDSLMPDLRHRNQAITPQAFVKPESKFPEFLRIMMILNALILNNWNLFQVAVIMYGVGMIVAGGILIIAGFLTKDKNAVQELKETEEDEE